VPSCEKSGRATDIIRADHTRVVAVFHRSAGTCAHGGGNLLSCDATAGGTVLDDLEPEHEEMRSLIPRRFPAGSRATRSTTRPSRMTKRRMELMAPAAAPPRRSMIGAGALLAGLYLLRRRA
jgi:hypothetical protein